MSDGNIATAKININVGSIGGQITGTGSSSNSDALLQKILAELKKANAQNKKQSNDLKNVFSAGNFGKTLGRALGMAGIVGGAITAAGAGAVAGVAGAAAADYNVPNVGKGYDKVMADGVEKVAIINEVTGEITDIITMQKAEQLGILDEFGDIKAGLRVQSDEYTSQTQGITRTSGVLQTSEKTLRALTTVQLDQLRANQEQLDIQLAVNALERARLKKMAGGDRKAAGIGPTVRSDVTTPNMSTVNGPVDSTVTTIERLAGAKNYTPVPPVDIASYSKEIQMNQRITDLWRSPNVVDNVMSASLIISMGLR